MARKSRTTLQESGKVRGVTNKDIDFLADALRHFNFNLKIEVQDAVEED